METASAGGELTSTQTTSRTVAAGLGATGQGGEGNRAQSAGMGRVGHDGVAQPWW